MTYDDLVKVINGSKVKEVYWNFTGQPEEGPLYPTEVKADEYNLHTSEKWEFISFSDLQKPDDFTIAVEKANFISAETIDEKQIVIKKNTRGIEVTVRVNLV